MKKKMVIKQLIKLKEQILVNNELKENLRKKFRHDIRKKHYYKFSFATVSLFSILIAILIFLMYNNIPQMGFQKTRAENLNVTNQVSFIDIGEGNFLSICEYNHSIYYSVNGKGIFRYDKNGIKKISSEEGQTISVSSDGKLLAISNNGNIRLLELSTGKTLEILTSKNPDVYYKDAKFLSNDSLIFVKEVVKFRKTHGFDIVESGIYKINLKTKRISSKLADGSSPSGVDDYIVFEKDSKIFLKDINKNKETFVDNGRFPSLSYDKKYIIYVKYTLKDYTVEKNIKVRANLSNIWIADFDLKTKKCLTNNSPSYSNKSLENLYDKTLLTGGVYDYLDPIFSSNSKDIYAIKAFNVEGMPFRIMKISADYKGLSATETVETFIQALIRRDDDFGKMLMETPPDFLTWSNPHIVGYEVINESKTHQGTVVNTNIFYSYTADAYWQINKTQFYLKSEKGRYKIVKTKILESIEVLASHDGKRLILRSNNNEKNILTINDIPKSILPKNNYRFSSLVFNQNQNLLVFTIQEMNTGYVLLFSYNLNSNKLKFIDKIEDINQNYDVGISNLIIDSSGNYIALDLYTTDKNGNFKNFVVVYNLKDNEKVYVHEFLKSENFINCYTQYWKDQNLIFEANTDNLNLLYIYDAKDKVIWNY